MPTPQLVAKATYEEIIPGDFVHLASGGPIGLVQKVEKGQATVVWFNDQMDHSMVPWVCLRLVPRGEIAL